MNIRPVAIVLLGLFLFGCEEKQLPREISNLLGEWVGESTDEIFSDCDEKLGPRTLYTARKLIVEPSNIREIVDVISVGTYDQSKALEKILEIKSMQFLPPINGELQKGFHVAVFEFNHEGKLLAPADFDIKTSGMDLRRRIVSLTKKNLVLERSIPANHPDSSCANKVIERSVYRRHI